MVSAERHRRNLTQHFAGEASCWICLGVGLSESGEPLRRDCSCRGESAGFAHLSCLVKYAQKKTEGWDGRANAPMGPWRNCVHCGQGYQNKLALDLADEFVDFVGGNSPSDRLKLAKALVHKISVLLSMRGGLQRSQKEEGKELANRTLFLVREMKNENPSPPRTILRVEAHAHNYLGILALRRGTEESARESAGHFAKYHQLCKSNGFAEGLAAAEANIAIARSKYEVDSKVSEEELLWKQREVYGHRVVAFGENSQRTLIAGLSLSVALRDGGRAFEAIDLLARLADVSQRWHGPDHCITKEAASLLNGIRN